MADFDLMSENEEEERRTRRAARIAEMKRLKEQQQKRRMMIKKTAPWALGGICVLVVFLVVGSFTRSGFNEGIEKENADIVQQESAGITGQEDVNVVEQEGISVAEQDGNGATTQESNSVAESENAGTTAIGMEYAMVEAVVAANSKRMETAVNEAEASNVTTDAVEVSAGEVTIPYSAQVTDHTVQLGNEIVSSNAVLIDLSTNSILARKAETEIISPASMTKVLTVLVAAEHVTELDDTFTITIDITDYSYVNDCSNVGFARDETVTVRDLFYGTILPSGADAAVGLATYVAGSQEEFVKLMNEKLDELGLSDTAHFTNCVGLYDEDHYCSVYDMAVIMQAAMENELCREVMSAKTYTTSSTPEHPEGLLISNWFLRRIEDKDAGGEVLCGKTGYVVESGSCAASYGESESGKGYICVTADATSSWTCIGDHVDIYKKYMESSGKSDENE